MIATLSSWFGRDVDSRASRSSLARSRYDRWRRLGSVSELIRESRDVAESLRTDPNGDLQTHTSRLRRFAPDVVALADRRRLTLAAGGVLEAVRRCLGIELFDTQLHAGFIISQDGIAEMQTGEGKTLAGIMPAYFRALDGCGVHVATPNDYLAKRDHSMVAPVLATLGVTTGLLQNGISRHAARQAYAAGVTYGSGHTFGFDYLRDQLTLSGASHFGQLGAATLERIRGLPRQSQRLQRGLHASIVDEIDHVLIDDAVSPLLLRGGGNEVAADATIHRAAAKWAAALSEREDYLLRRNRNSVELTDSGLARLYDDEPMAAHPQLRRPWHEYVTLALKSRLVLRRDVDYVVNDQEIRLVDLTTGRVFTDRTWSGGLHQAVQAAEGLKISTESEPLARITRQRFYRYYRSLGGMTGTASGCEQEFASVYGLPVMAVPLRVPSRRREHTVHVSADRNEKVEAITAETLAVHRQGRAVLIGTYSIADSREIAASIRQRGLRCTILNGIQSEDEAAVIARAGQVGAITVATNLAGRGTDIALAPEVAHNGGLHVIVSETHPLARVDRQLQGRAARCGDPGSTRVFLAADDPLCCQRAPWLRRAMLRLHAAHGGGSTSSANDDAEVFPLGALQASINRVRRKAQRDQASRRWSLLQTDRETEQLLQSTPSALQECWQL